MKKPARHHHPAGRVTQLRLGPFAVQIPRPAGKLAGMKGKASVIRAGKFAAVGLFVASVAALIVLHRLGYGHDALTGCMMAAGASAAAFAILEFIA
ncbi:hypothetical protein AYO47_00025 [Planctomyces sp. SCGC AG-212-M04]|nr:hypothetical protein AYO47_00025 [Planctomyces sp. SCGC AG-212-M04]